MIYSLQIVFLICLSHGTSFVNYKCVVSSMDISKRCVMAELMTVFLFCVYICFRCQEIALIKQYHLLAEASLFNALVYYSVFLMT